MILFKEVSMLSDCLKKKQQIGCKIGFVPTMGALHSGHISLIEASKKVNDVTVCSIFVNPTQFNNAKDLEKYPITVEQDILMLEAAACDILFLPSVEEIYPQGVLLNKNYELGSLETVLEGKFRAGHYQGVCMVVDRLLKIIVPNNLYIGQKDFQQCMVLTKLIELIGLEKIIDVTICPTIRENDGLAMSSRNRRLSEKERELAPIIFQTLSFINESQHSDHPLQLKKSAANILQSAGLDVDYLEIVDSTTLLSINNWEETKKPIVLVAAFINEIRLIDNLLMY